MKLNFTAALAAFIIIAVTGQNADARPRHHRVHHHVVRADVSSDIIVCTQTGCARARARETTDAPSSKRGAYRASVADANGNGTIVGSRPSGCPHRYCGCAASLYVFGEIRPELNLALNWARKFPRTSPASGMVAARSGHVMVLMSHATGDEWLVHDGNSGGGRTREHVRSIRGYTIVNPRATVMASKDH